MHDDDFYKKLISLESDLEHLINQNDKLIKQNSGLKRDLIKAHQNLLSSDNINLCPICGHESKFFEPLNATHPFDLVRCPYCDSLHRHRLVFLVLKLRFKELLNDNIKLLHFAPELSLYNFFTNKRNIDYFPVDLNPEYYERKDIFIREKVNMENIPYDDNTFDIIYNSHVLEHVPDDIHAMAELYRVLKPKGICIIMVPMSSYGKTREKEEYNTPELRLKYYYQEDHLRLYGADFKDRLISVGFNVEEINAESLVGISDMKKYVLVKRDKVFLCTKK